MSVALRTAVDLLTRLALARPRSRVEPRFSGPAKVNLGSGLEVVPGWINVEGSLHAVVAGAPGFIQTLAYRASGSQVTYSLSDYRRRLRANRFVAHDLRQPLPFEDTSIDYVYASHIFEVLYLDQTERLLGEIHRILKPGGRVRAGVRDLTAILEDLAAGNRREAVATLFGLSDSTYLNRHRSGYDSDLFGDMLRRAGFVDITHQPFRKGAVPDSDLLDNKPDITFFMEAIRSGCR